MEVQGVLDATVGNEVVQRIVGRHRVRNKDKKSVERLGTGGV